MTFKIFNLPYSISTDQSEWIPTQSEQMFALKNVFLYLHVSILYSPERDALSERHTLPSRTEYYN